MFNDLLEELEENGFQVFAYADDLAIVGRTEDKVREAMKRVGGVMGELFVPLTARACRCRCAPKILLRLSSRHREHNGFFRAGSDILPVLSKLDRKKKC